MSLPLRTRTHLTVAATIAVAITGCSITESTSSTSSASSEDVTVSSTGPAITDGSATQGADKATTSADGPPTPLESADKAFTVKVPAGWKDALDTAPEGTVLAAQSTTRTGDSFTTVVITSGDSVTDLDEVMAASIETLKNDDVDVTAAKNTEIDDHVAYGFTTTTVKDNDTITNRQRYVNFDGALYTLTFSAPQVKGKTSDLAVQEFQAILDSWSWSTNG